MIFHDLSVTPFSEVFRRVSSQRLSGDLQVRAGRTAKLVFFDRGALVFAASNARQDRLGESLVAAGHLTQQQFDMASALMRQERGARFGEALRAAGVMDETQVGRAVVTQVERIVLSLFSVTDGVASLEERRCPIPPRYMISLSLHRLLYRGIKTMRSAALVGVGIGDLERRVVTTDVPPFRYALERAPKDEHDLLKSASRPVPLKELTSRDGQVHPQLLRTAYSLVASGILSEADPVHDTTHPVIQIDAREFALAGREGPADGEAPSVATARQGEGTTAEALSVATASQEEEGSAEIALDAGIVGPRPEQAPPARPAGTTDPTDPAVDSEVQELRRQVGVHEMIKNYAEILKIYARLVELRPADVVYRKKLAISMSLFPGTVKQAERQFLEALRLDPDDADLHCEFGRYYERVKHKGRARAEYRLALSLDPKHRKATEALRALSPRDSALSALKQLFKG